MQQLPKTPEDPFAFEIHEMKKNTKVLEELIEDAFYEEDEGFSSYSI